MVYFSLISLSPQLKPLSDEKFFTYFISFRNSVRFLGQKSYWYSANEMEKKHYTQFFFICPNLPATIVLDQWNLCKVLSLFWFWFKFKFNKTKKQSSKQRDIKIQRRFFVSCIVCMCVFHLVHRKCNETQIKPYW